MRKLVVYPDEQTMLKNASSYPLLWNYNHAGHCGEFDDGVGNSGHIDFAFPGIGLPDVRYDSVEFVGWSQKEVQCPVQ